ncbi:MAG: ATP-binding protein [Deltaproteobacteria bacterium]|nr:ATP-binding protein [Deltaproteobacteria bacterium]
MQAPAEIAVAELEVRCEWALARLGEIVNAGRASGWLRGDVMSAVQDAEAVLSSAVRELPGSSPMRTLATRLGLSTSEMDVLWILACVELSPLLSHAAQLLVSPGMFELNIQILAQLATSPDSELDGDTFHRLARFGLIEASFDSRVPLSRRAVRPSDRVVELARGHFGLDRELAEVARLDTALASRRMTAGLELNTPAELSHAMNTAANVLVVATGNEGSGRQTLLRHAISSAGRTVLIVRAGRLATDPEKLTRQLNAIARECRLHDAWPLLLEVDGVADRADMVDRELLSVHEGPVLVTARESCTWPVARALITIPVALPDIASRIAMWQQALPDAGVDVIQACANRYSITPGLLSRTAVAASALAQNAERVEVDHVHKGLRVQLERRLLGLAHRVETKQTWGDLVLPVDQFDLLIEMVARVRHKRLVFDTWGFADKVGKGLGLSALLSGPPGTGKTMVAGLVARELGLDLYQVDLSRVVSKFIGETEKQLAALFEAAESGHAILLFDEADSLFGKRTEVKSSNDRYANLEVNYLLQRMEAFSGISLLTTNHETAIDKAFQRRLAFHIRVPMPEEPQRASLWETMIPERAERSADLDFAALSKEFVMSGGYIKNAVLRAAFLAADEGTAITNAHLLRAARCEYEAMGKVTFQSTTTER